MAETGGRRGAARAGRRQEIIEVALDLFCQRGYDGTTLRQIGERLGFTVAALYYYFQAKDDLLAAVAEPYLDALEAVIVAAEADKPLDARRGRRVLEAYLDLLLANTKRTQFLEQDLAVQAGPVGARLAELTERLNRSLAGPDAQPSDLVRAAAALGSLRRPVRRLPQLDLDEFRTQLLDQAVSLLYRPSSSRKHTRRPRPASS